MNDHPILFPVETPDAQLDFVLQVAGPFPARVRIPVVARGSIADKTLAVIACTCVDSPGIACARLLKHTAHVDVRPTPGHPPPQSVTLHLRGRSIFSPPAWEEHSRGSAITNQRVFASALPRSQQ